MEEGGKKAKPIDLRTHRILSPIAISQIFHILNDARLRFTTPEEAFGTECRNAPHAPPVQHPPHYKKLEAKARWRVIKGFMWGKGVMRKQIIKNAMSKRVVVLLERAVSRFLMRSRSGWAISSNHLPCLINQKLSKACELTQVVGPSARPPSPALAATQRV